MSSKFCHLAISNFKDELFKKLMENLCALFYRCLAIFNHYRYFYHCRHCVFNPPLKNPKEESFGFSLKNKV